MPAHKSAASEEKNDSASSGDGRFLVVGIGASAGGLDALRRFFQALPEEDGMAFVVIVHLAPEHESNLATLLQSYTEMPVRQVTERLRIEPGRIYVIPPNKSLSISNGDLDLSAFEQPRGQRAPIDLFFRSLAAVGGEGVAVILSGTGTDGTVGLKAIKEEGGLVMVQAPDDAQHDGMPRSAIATGLVDVVGAADELARRLVRYRDERDRIQVPEQPEALPEDDADAVERILAQVRARTGHDFGQYKRTTVLRRIGRRMQMNQIMRLAEYLEFLRGNAEEAQALLKNLLISVTNFFRDADAWDALEKEVVPKLFQPDVSDRPVRVWVPGCATGEEAYSVAMLLLEHAGRLDRAPEVQVFATDLDEQALAYAREGLYPAVIAADVSEARLKRFFIQEDDHYRIRKDVRERVLIAVHSLLKDPPFSKLDLISCRNLLIYMNRELQEQVLELFHYALRPGGYLFLGSAESADGAATLFRTANKKQRIYRARKTAEEPLRLPSLPLAEAAPSRPAPHRKPDGRRTTEAERHLRLLEAYAPPSVVVGRDYDLLHLSEHAGRYLRRPGGSPSLNVLEEVRPELRLELQTALFQAFEHGRSTSTQPVQVAFNGDVGLVHLIVRPAGTQDEPPDRVLVIFTEVEASEDAEDEGRAENARVRRLERELQRMRERLQATVEEYESSKEEMKAANEELQSMNEEYKSTTEELETSKEELQSVNEELETVNLELKNKVEALSEANSDLQNLMASLEVGTLFLDRGLEIKRFTPRVAEVFNIVTGDVGRPIAHLTHKLDYDTLEEDAQRVLKQLTPVEREVHGEEDRWFLVRLQPYRTVDEKIDGVVVTFIDITKRKRSEEKVRRLNEELEERVQARTAELEAKNETLTQEIAGRKRAREALERERERAQRYLDVAGVLFVALDRDGRVTLINQRGCRTLGYSEEEIIGKDWFEHFLPAHQREHVRRVFDALIAGDIEGGEYFENPVVTREGEELLMLWHNVIIRDEQGEVVGTLGSGTDITERVRAEERDRFHARIFSQINEGVVAVDAEGRVTYLNEAIADLMDLDAEAAPGRPLLDLYAFRWVDPEDAQRSRAVLEATGRWKGEVVLIRHDGKEIPIELSVSNLTDKAGNRTGRLAVIRDITQRKQDLDALHESEQRFRDLFENAPDAIFVEDLEGHVLDVNPAACRLHNTDREALIGLNVVDLVPPDQREVAMQDFEKLVEGEISHLQAYSWTVNQHAVPVEVRATRFTYGRQPAVLLHVRDISERKKAEEILQQSEERYRAVVETQTELICRFTPDTTITFVNEAYCAYFGKSAEELVGQSFLSLIPEKDHDYVRKHIARLLQNPETVASYEHEVLLPDGGLRWQEWVDRPIRDAGGRIVEFLSVGRDITDRRRLEQEVLRISEEERQRIGQDIHDELASLFSGIALWSWGLVSQRKKGERVRTETLEKINELARTGAEQARALAHGLAPVTLEREGLEAALNELARGIETLSDLSCTFEMEELPALRIDVAGQLFRIAQEALTNASKHAGATQVALRIHRQGERLVLTVSDDGEGLPDEAHGSEGMGLHIMPYRARMIGATFTIDSAPGAGTTVSCSLPLEEATRD